MLQLEAPWQDASNEYPQHFFFFFYGKLEKIILFITYTSPSP